MRSKLADWINRRAARNVLCWATAAVLVPLLPIMGPIVFRYTTFIDSVDQGQVWALALAIAGGSLAVELLLVKSDRLMSDAYQLLTFLLVLVTLLGAVLTHPAIVKRRLTPAECTDSAYMLAFVSIIGVTTAVRQIKLQRDN